LAGHRCVIADFGSAGMGLVWGWLLGSNRTSGGRTVLLIAIALANAALAARLGGAWAALALVAAMLVGAWLHLTWTDQLRTRRGRTEGEE
jgi:NhaP-type Na+/H+ or K+/H+ antiporter